MSNFGDIEEFLNFHIGKKVVLIQGLGFVGAVMSMVCANSESEDYAVIGIDLDDEKNKSKIRSLNNGTFPIVASDQKIEKFYQNSRNKKNFYATCDETAYSKADTIIVDINLDVKKETDFDGNLLSYDVDLVNFKHAIQTIGKYCKENVLILVETTVPPGTCLKVIKPIIESSLKERGMRSDQFNIGHSYERVMPGPNYIDSIKNFYRVYSGINDRSAEETEKFLNTIISVDKYPLTRLSNTNATEYAKVLENSYRAVNIAFATEWSRFAEEANVNMYEVVDAIRLRPTHSNLMYPGIGVGGYCLTKDPLLASWAKQKHFDSDIGLEKSEQGVMTNDLMPSFAYNYMIQSFNLTDLSDKIILILGVSYRGNVGDTRYSPVEKFYKFCQEKGANIQLHDPYVKHWDEMNLDINQNLEECLDQYFDILVIATSHSDYLGSNKLISKLCQKTSLMIYDTVGILNASEIEILRNKHELKVLGRGDI